MRKGITFGECFCRKQDSSYCSMMACMMFKDVATIKPYYVVPEKYNTILLEEKRNQETEGMKDIITLPEYKIEIPMRN
jgi:hypothetical protein